MLGYFEKRLPPYPDPEPRLPPKGFMAFVWAATPGVRGYVAALAGYDDAFITDVESHCRVWEGERSMLQKTLLAVDEMTGFIIACALVRPDRSLENLEVKSVMKKIKDKAFARAVNRETLTGGAQEMNVDFAGHVAFLTQALAAAVKQPDYQEVPLI